jgi:hypothetical protein
MKIAITGHTSGLGRYIFENLNCDGFSRSNGYDISKNFYDVTKTIKDYDVFINNANVENFQYLLCKEVWEHWKLNPDKKIINIGSRAKTFIKSEYGLNKKILSDFTTYANFNGKCKVSCLEPGYIDENNLSYKDVFEVLKFIIEKNYIIESFVFFKKGEL